MRQSLIVCIFLVIASCDMVFDIDVPFEKKQLVVNSYINPDSVFSVAVSLNKHILDTLDHQLVVNATVVIYENDIAIPTGIPGKRSLHFKQ